jgi:MFS family permease
MRDTSRWSRFFILTSLYFAQGLPFGFFTQFLPVMLRHQGVSLEAIGASYLLALPWSLKFLWAPLVDRYSFASVGRRRSWILPVQALSIIALFLLSFVDPTRALRPLFLSIVLCNFLAATQDIATDGLAVDTLHERDRGIGNAIQVAGYRVGMIVGGGLLLPFFALTNWRFTVLAMAAGLLIASVPVLLFREPQSEQGLANRSTTPREQGPYRTAGRAARSMLQSITAFGWRRPGILQWVFLLLTYKTGDSLASGMVRPFTVDRGVSLAQIGWMLGILGFSAGLLGAVVGGALVNALGRKRALIGFGLLQALSVALYAAIAAAKTSTLAVLAIAATFEHFAGGCATAALFTVMMDACRKEQSATDYTVQSCAVVIATGSASALSGVVAHALGYPGMFALAAALCVLGVVYVALTFDAAKQALSRTVSSAE